MFPFIFQVLYSKRYSIIIEYFSSSWDAILNENFSYITNFTIHFFSSLFWHFTSNLNILSIHFLPVFFQAHIHLVYTVFFVIRHSSSLDLYVKVKTYLFKIFFFLVHMFAFCSKVITFKKYNFNKIVVYFVILPKVYKSNIKKFYI